MAADTAAQATNRGFISAAKEYQAGEELTFDYGLLNDAVLAFYGANPSPPFSRAIVFTRARRHSHPRLPRPQKMIKSLWLLVHTRSSSEVPTLQLRAALDCVMNTLKLLALVLVLIYEK